MHNKFDDNFTCQLSAQAKILFVTKLIPVSKVATYGQIADLAGLPKSARLVGKTLANLTPQESECIPWHRVINAQGKLSLPLGSASFTNQQQKLMAENVIVNGAKVNLTIYQWQPELSELLLALPF